MKKINVFYSFALASAAALATASPSVAYFKGDKLYASDEAAYCKSIADLQTYTALIKAKDVTKASSMAGCGTVKKNGEAVALDISYHGYAIVRLELQGGAHADVYVQKNLWWTKEEEKYFTCMRVRADKPFTEAYKTCQEEMFTGVDPKATPDLAVAYKCAECHGATDKSGKPNLVGMSKEYILKSVNAYKSGARNDSTMAGVAQKLSAEDAARAANYFSESQCK